MISVMGRAIDNVFQETWDTVVAIMNRDGPDIDGNVETQVGHLVQRKEERVDVIRNTLQKAIHGVESVTCEGCSNLPAMMGLVQMLWKERTELVPRFQQGKKKIWASVWHLRSTLPSTGLRWCLTAIYLRL